MYAVITVPVDLAHQDALTKALDTAANLSRHFKAPVRYVGVTGTTPDAVAHSPGEYRERLDAFAKDQSEKHGIDATSETVVSHDPAVDLNASLLSAIHQSDAELVVMASHVPGLREHLFSSHAGWIASHAHISVLVVR